MFLFTFNHGVALTGFQPTLARAEKFKKMLYGHLDFFVYLQGVEGEWGAYGKQIKGINIL